MAFTYHYEKAELGDWRSPLDFVRSVILSHADWEVKKEVYSAAPLTGNQRLDELWIQSLNTTSGQILAMQFKFTYGAGIEVAFSRDTDLGLPWDEQPEAPKDSASREGGNGNYMFTRQWGRTLDPIYTLIVLNQDHIHIVWKGGEYDYYTPYIFSVTYSALDKSHNYLDGVVWTVSGKSGKSYMGIHYNEHWYQDGFDFTTSIEALQGKINDLANDRMFEKNYTVHGLYVSPVSIHCNTELSGAFDGLELAGFLPSGIYGTVYHSFPKSLVREHIQSKDYIALPVEQIPHVNALLYPLS